MHPKGRYGSLNRVWADAKTLPKSRNKRPNSALSAITAAVVGVVLNLAVWFSLHTLFGKVTTRNVFGLSLQIPEFATADIGACAIAFLACLLTFYWKKGLAVTLGASAAAGAALYLLLCPD